MLHLYKIHSQSRLFFCFQRIHLFINIGNTNHGSLEQLLVVELMLFPAPITCYLMLSPEVTLFSFPLSSLELYLQTNYSSISSFGILGTYVAVLSVLFLLCIPLPCPNFLTKLLSSISSYPWLLISGLQVLTLPARIHPSFFSLAPRMENAAGISCGMDLLSTAVEMKGYQPLSRFSTRRLLG